MAGVERVQEAGPRPRISSGCRNPERVQESSRPWPVLAPSPTLDRRARRGPQCSPTPAAPRPTGRQRSLGAGAMSPHWRVPSCERWTWVGAGGTMENSVPGGLGPRLESPNAREPAGMTRVFPVGLRHGASKQFASIEALLRAARGHAYNRLMHSCEAILLIGALARGAKPAHVPNFTIGAACVQDAVAGGDRQAAHLLPGQVFVNGRPAWVCAASKEAKVALIARFMATSPVPAPFNRADSAAEKAGLRDAFVGACRASWMRVMSGANTHHADLKDFLQRATSSFAIAEQQKRSKDGILAARGKDADSDERLVEALVLAAFQQHGVTASAAMARFPRR